MAGQTAEGLGSRAKGKVGKEKAHVLSVSTLSLRKAQVLPGTTAHGSCLSHEAAGLGDKGGLSSPAGSSVQGTVIFIE